MKEGEKERKKRGEREEKRWERKGKRKKRWNREEKKDFLLKTLREDNRISFQRTEYLY